MIDLYFLGAGFRDKRCALCRSEIPEDFLTKQSIQISPSTEQEPDRDADRFVWFYEGYNGWWRYDERNGAEVEKAFGDGRPSVDLLLAGNVYVVNFRKMIQYRKSEPAKRRRVKRDLVKTPVKGVAGLKIVPPTVVSVENPIQSTNGPSTSDAGEKSLADLVNRLTIGEDEENS